MDFSTLVKVRQSDRRYKPQAVEADKIDLCIAVSHFTLQAADLGLGTCIIGWFNERRVRKALGIPRGKRIPLLITLGYPEGPTRRKSRKTTAQMSSRNRY